LRNTKFSLISILLVLIIIILSVILFILNSNLGDFSTKNENLSAELDAYKVTSLELEERVNKITNNYGSGGGTIKRVFETADGSDVVDMVDFFSFDRYHLVYFSKNQIDTPFKWETKNKGSVIFNNYHFEFEATTVDTYVSKPYDLNTNILKMTGLAKVNFSFNVNGLGEIVPVDKTGDVAGVAEFEIVKYQLEVTDSGLGEANINDTFDLKIIPNSVEAAGLYSVFGEDEVLSGRLELSEITIDKSER